MNIEKRLLVLINLGKFLKTENGKNWKEELAYKAEHQNNWFTPKNVANAFEALETEMLDKDKLKAFVEKYNFKDDEKSKIIGVLMAGNIPLVGFYDAICVFLSGHILWAKLSSQDEVLMKAILNKIIEIEPQTETYIKIVDRLNNIEALIATGSDNTAMHFEQYFKHVPKIIRKNRSSVAVLTGKETNQSLEQLGTDIFSYYGLGCRNVSKFYIPKDFKPDSFYEAIEPMGEVMKHHKYKNNYDYNRSVLLVNGTLHFDNGFLMLQPSEQFVSPISVIFTEEYSNNQDLQQKLNSHQEKTQCIVSENAWLSGSFAFGTAQKPSLTDFADGVDVLQFLLDIK